MTTEINTTADSHIQKLEAAFQIAYQALMQTESLFNSITDKTEDNQDAFNLSCIGSNITSTNTVKFEHLFNDVIADMQEELEAAS